jgi:tetratricopeptide (TPR) repeat protein
VREARPGISHLLTPIYLGAVATLVLNDHVLKQAFPGLITGKLSDFAGLFAFAVFLSVAIRRHIPAIHVAIAGAFVAWKSPLADPLIEAWNATLSLRIARVVDYGDLLALSVLPLSLAYLHRQRWAIAPSAARTVVVAMTSLVAFTATSMPLDRLAISSGNDYAQAGRYEEAIKEYDRAIEVRPSSGEALYLRGVAKLKLGDTAGGEADIAAAAAIDPKYKQFLAGGTSQAN